MSFSINLLGFKSRILLPILTVIMISQWIKKEDFIANPVLNSDFIPYNTIFWSNIFIKQHSYISPFLVD